MVIDSYSMSVWWIWDGKIANKVHSMELAITSLTSNKQEWNTCFSQLNYPQCKVEVFQLSPAKIKSSFA